MNKKVLDKTKIWFQLSLWLLFGFLLIITNYLYLDILSSLNSSPEFALLNLVGVGIYALGGLLLLAIIDLLYVILFLKWILVDRKNSGRRNKTLVLP